eukprot:gene29127-32345_t
MAHSYLYNEGDLSETLTRDIPWETYMTARLISDKELSLIRRYDKRSEDLRSSMLEETGPAYIEAFLSVLKAVTKEDTVQYVLTVLLQLLQENPGRAKLFHPSEQSSTEPYTVLLRLLQRPDWPTQEKAARILTAVIESRPKKGGAFVNGYLAADQTPGSSFQAQGAPDAAEGHITTFIEWLCSQLRRPSNPSPYHHLHRHITTFIEWLCSQLRRPSNPSRSVPTAAAVLSALLKERGCRQLFLRTSGGLQLLPPFLKSFNSPTYSQLLYELCMCVWQMTFIKQAAESLGQAGVVKALVDVCRVAQKEKVFRVALSSLRNLLNYDDLGLASDMVEAGLPKIVITRQLQMLSSSEKYGREMLSSFEKYRKEVMSGQLDWSPMHTSDVFWRENVDMFEEKDFQVLRVKTLAVGCHDLGMFIMHHPQGRYIVSDLRGKELVMRLMAHPDAEVQKQALLCIQKVMLTKDKLDFLGTS